MPELGEKMLPLGGGDVGGMVESDSDCFEESATDALIEGAAPRRRKKLLPWPIGGKDDAGRVDEDLSVLLIGD